VQILNDISLWIDCHSVTASKFIKYVSIVASCLRDLCFGEVEFRVLLLESLERLEGRINLRCEMENQHPPHAF
jgi:hypothetical protein